MAPLIALPPDATPPTRAFPSLVIHVCNVRVEQQTEEAGPAPWPVGGIDYERWTPLVKPSPRDAFGDRLAMLEAVDD